MKQIITIVLLFIGLLGYSQQIVKESIDSGGGVAFVSGIKVINTIGEVVVAEKNNGTLYISEGFIGAEFATFLEIDNYTELIGISAFPNPTTEILTINFSETHNYQIQVFDLLGKEVIKKESNNANNYSLDVTNLQTASYIVLIKDINSKQFKTFRLLKE